MVTNYGRNHNRKSMYDTTRDYLLHDEPVTMDGVEHSSLISVILADYEHEIVRYNEFVDLAEKAFQEKKYAQYRKFMEKSSETEEVISYLKARIIDAYKLSDYYKKEEEIITKKMKKHHDLSQASLEDLFELQCDLYHQNERELNRFISDAVKQVSLTQIEDIEYFKNKVDGEIEKRFLSEGMGQR